MSDQPAAPPAWTPPGNAWLSKKFVFFIAFALALHVALIFLFGTKKQIIPRAVNSVPHLRLADRADEFIAFSDPTLFARPNAHDVVTQFWRQTPVAGPRFFGWTEAPRYLTPAPENFGAAFRNFMLASRPAEFRLDLKSEPKLTVSVAVPADDSPAITTMQITGELAQRRRLNEIALPSIPVNDVIAPSKVQALVDTEGNVASAVLLESSALAAADQRALQLARQLRFAPAPQLMFGEIQFNWHTVPLANTNETH